MKREKTEMIVIHCSASEWGDSKAIGEWHKEKWGSEYPGYHYIINNCYPTFSSFKYKRPDILADGFVQHGRPEDLVGAHLYDYNDSSIGICLIGTNSFTNHQIVSLAKLVNNLLIKYQLKWKDVFGHYQFTDRKSCPNISMKYLIPLLGDISNDLSSYSS